jgi:uncharacterized iron-regulated membrane protein
MTLPWIGLIVGIVLFMVVITGVLFKANRDQ